LKWRIPDPSYRQGCCASTRTPAEQESNISLAPSHMPSGPFKITPVSCKAGKGLTFQCSNESNDLAGARFATVDFFGGSRVVGSNANFGTLKIDPAGMPRTP
jgi:hypothetical protein